MNNDEIKEDLKEKGRSGLLGNVHPSVIAIWAALIAVGNMLPGIPIIGSGGTFTVSAVFIPLSGIFFGPIAGAICAGVGQLIGQLIAPHIAWLGMGTFLVGALNGFATGLITRDRWYGAIGIIILGYILWFATEIGRGAPLFPIIFYSLGLLSVVLAAFYGNKKLLEERTFSKSIGIFLASYGGMVSAAAIANFFGIILLQIPSEAWQGLAFVSPWERTLFSVGAAIIGVPLLVGLPKIGVYVGPEYEEE